jgi:hypothetical protein
MRGIRTICRFDGEHGTFYAIDTEDISYRGKHDQAVRFLHEECEVADAEAVVYNASQSSRPYEF